MIFLKILFLASTLLILHSYLFYPLSLILFEKFFNRPGHPSTLPESELPFISTITSVYNEDKIIYDKIKSLTESDYPTEKLTIYIGSDASTDQSDQILDELQRRYSFIRFVRFEKRRGKTSVINDLMQLATQQRPTGADHVFVFTDANVILKKETLRRLAEKFVSPDIGLVDSRIIPKSSGQEGIADAEIRYISLETQIKHLEGKLWGMMMGAFGGCFAIRSNFATPIPERMITDDFYLSMNVLKNGGKCTSALDAVCLEGIPGELKEEFKRKVRISSGNFQSLKEFSSFLYSSPWTRAYAFISHKVIRWTGPFFLLMIWCISLILALTLSFPESLFFAFVFSAFLILPILDWLLSVFDIHIALLRAARYFLSMNIALLFGFVKYLRGIKHSIWEPPKRNNLT